MNKMLFLIIMNALLSLNLFSQGLPTEFRLHQNYPNPFGGRTWIDFDLPVNCNVSIWIEDTSKVHVASLRNSEMYEAGFQSVSWNCTNDSGSPVAPGVYILFMRADSQTTTVFRDSIRMEKLGGVIIIIHNRPTQFQLYQNLPNPFDGRGTCIKYDLPRDCYVHIWIEDSSSNIIQTSINESQLAGPRSFSFIPGELSSSNKYYCKMEATFGDTILFRDSITITFNPRCDIKPFFNSITFIDFGAPNLSQRVYFCRADSMVNINNYIAPPRPPDTIFDARFSNNTILAVRNTSQSDYPIRLINYSAQGLDVIWSIKDSSFKAYLNINGELTELIEGNSLQSVHLTSPIIYLSISSATGIWTTPQLANTYSLSQNYPNPFNPSTVIRFSLPASGYTTLKVYDVLGRNVTTLVSEFKHAGDYAIELNAANLPIGFYIYQLHSGSYAETKKLVLIR